MKANKCQWCGMQPKIYCRKPGVLGCNSVPDIVTGDTLEDAIRIWNELNPKYESDN